MKYLYLILYIYTFTSFAQSENFSIIENNVVWQKIYNDSINLDDFSKKLQLSGKFENLQTINETTLNFDIKYSNGDFKPYGYRVMNDAIFLQYESFAKGSIEIKNNRYRVTVFQMQTFDKQFNKVTSMSEYFLKKDKFREMKTVQRALEYYDKFYTNLFQSKDLNNKDW